MDRYQRNLAYSIVLFLAAASGTGCNPTSNFVRPMPRLLPPQPTLEQVVSVVNNNSSKIQSFSTNQARISVSGMPSLPATISMERPRRFRLNVDTAITIGPEFDLGSNDELFWFWYRGDPQQSVYFCRHDQFTQSAAHQAIPIAPAELFDALGLAQFDPALQHQGPFLRANGNIEIRTIRETPNGQMMKLTMVDPRGWIAEQYFYDAQGQLALSTVARQHRQDPLTNLIMPKVVEVNCPQQDFKMRISLGNVQINSPTPAQPELWTMPHYQGARLVDLGDPNLQLCPVSSPQTPAPQGVPTASVTRRTQSRRSR